MSWSSSTSVLDMDRMPLPNDTRAQHLQLAFDANLPFGAKDHFFHFLHGYLIPGLSLALARGVRSIGFEDCGPLMNPRIGEACHLAGLDLVPPEKAGDDAQGEAFPVPRWDNLLFRLDGSHQTGSEVVAFRDLTERVRLLLLARAEELCRRSGTLEYWQSTEILLLARSPDHPYYGPGGASRFPGYGLGRRALLNGAQIAEHLLALGRRVRYVDMGALPLWDQIMAFDHASAVVGARGAEFAHLFWMRPGTGAVMLATPLRPENHASRSLSEIFGIRFVAPPVTGDYFAFKPEKIAGYLAEFEA